VAPIYQENQKVSVEHQTYLPAPAPSLVVMALPQGARGLPRAKAEGHPWSPPRNHTHRYHAGDQTDWIAARSVSSFSPSFFNSCCSY